MLMYKYVRRSKFNLDGLQFLYPVLNRFRQHQFIFELFMKYLRKKEC